MAGIDSDLIRGHIDTIILKSLYHGDKYGLEIIQEIEDKSNGSYELKQPTLYSCLKRLEAQGLISSYWEDSEIGGKRHYYKLTEQGKETYVNNQKEWLRSREIIDNLIYNTTMDYAPIYDNDAEKPVQQTEEVPVIDKLDNIDEVDTDTEVAQENNTTTLPESFEYLAGEEQTDEFASFEQVESTAFNTFFESNNETASDLDFDNVDDIVEPTNSVNDNIQEEPEEIESEMVSLNIDDEDNDLDKNELVTYEKQEVEIYNEPASDLVVIDEQPEDHDVSNDDEIYNPEPSDDDIYSANEENFDDEIYNPQVEYKNESIFVEDELENLYNSDNDVIEEQPVEEHVIETPTYINFGNNNYEEVDITNVPYEEEKPSNSYFLDIEPDDDKQEQPEDLSIRETAQLINEKYNSSKIQHASQEEIESLYRTTENYDNLQAGYTDETYKQILNELESYGSVTPQEPVHGSKHNALSYSDLYNKFFEEGIIIRKFEKQVKESNESKIYIRTNKIHFIKNWITFGITSFALLLVFLIMNAFKESYTYNFAFWQFAVAFGVSLIIPAYSTIKYLIWPYHKTVAKYAPRLNILLNVLITIQLILIIYCLNLQLGFYSFSQENYNHLLWILPLVLSFTPIIQALVYYPLYNSKKFHT